MTLFRPMTLFRLFPIAVTLAAASACSDPLSGPLAQPTVDVAFASPQGIAATDRWILVANSAFTFEQGRAAWQQGFVTIVDRHTRRVLGRVVTTQPNPQQIAVHRGRAYVVNSGTTATHRDGPVTVTSDGGIDIIAVDGPVPRAVSANIPLPRSDRDPRIGGFGTIVIGSGGRIAFVGSGTRGDLFEIDLVAGRVRHGADDPIVVFATAEGENGLSVVRPWGAGLVALNFNSDELCLAEELTAGLAQRRCHPIGVDDQLLEGPADVAFDEKGRGWVLMTVANALYRLDFTPEGVAMARFAQTGLANNRLRLWRGRAYVVNSLSNNLQRVGLEDGASELPFAVLPVKSNPYDLVITEEVEGERAWVTLFGSHQLALIDLASGEVIELIDGAEPGAAGVDGGNGNGNGGDAGAGGDVAAPCEPTGSPAVGIENVVELVIGPGGGQGQPDLPGVIQGAPRGGGDGGGSMDVLSLGEGGEVIVDFGAREIVDGPGVDFIVFENPFLAAPYQPFAEPAVVGAGETLETLVDFPCDLQRDQGDAGAERWPFPGCAGVRPVWADAQSNCVDPTDPEAAGGDAFDLATVGLSRARYLRLRDAGLSRLGDKSRGFDLDAVVLIHHGPRR